MAVPRRHVGRPLSFPVTVTPAQRRELEAWTNDALMPQPLVRHAWLVLLVSRGRPVQTAARQVGLSRGHATKWLKRWLAEGLHGLRDRRQERVPANRAQAHAANEAAEARAMKGWERA